jgi:hypothetical protein
MDIEVSGRFSSDMPGGSGVTKLGENQEREKRGEKYDEENIVVRVSGFTVLSRTRVCGAGGRRSPQEQGR